MICYLALKMEISEAEIVVLDFILLAYYLVNIVAGFLKKINYYDDLVDKVEINKNVYLFSYIFFSIIRLFMELIEQNYFLVTLSFSFWFSWALRNWLVYTKY